MTPDKDLLALVREVSEITGASAVLRIMEAHGFTHAVRFEGGPSTSMNISWADSLSDIIERIAKEKAG